jgi:hypothetical protein
LNGTTQFAEVRYYFEYQLDSTSATTQCLALLSLYSLPNPDLLECSTQTYISCSPLGDVGVIAVNIKSINHVIAMIPEVCFGEDHFYMAPRPGADVDGQHHPTLRSCLQSKESISVAQLCDALPSPFTTFLSYVCDLSFTQKPDYNYVLNLFHALHADTAVPPPVLSPAVEMSEWAYWTEDAVSLHPKLAVSVYETPRKQQCNTTVAPPTSVKRCVASPR